MEENECRAARAEAATVNTNANLVTANYALTEANFSQTYTFLCFRLILALSLFFPLSRSSIMKNTKRASSFTGPML